MVTPRDFSLKRVSLGGRLRVGHRAAFLTACAVSGKACRGLRWLCAVSRLKPGAVTGRKARAELLFWMVLPCVVTPTGCLLPAVPRGVISPPSYGGALSPGAEGLRSPDRSHRRVSRS